MDLDGLLDAAAVVGQGLKQSAIGVLEVAKDKVTPAFIKRMRAKKIHELNVQSTVG
jgi:hypothetical protein